LVAFTDKHFKVVSTCIVIQIISKIDSSTMTKDLTSNWWRIKGEFLKLIESILTNNTMKWVSFAWCQLRFKIRTRRIKCCNHFEIKCFWFISTQQRSFFSIINHRQFTCTSVVIKKNRRTREWDGQERNKKKFDRSFVYWGWESGILSFALEIKSHKTDSDEIGISYLLIHQPSWVFQSCFVLCSKIQKLVTKSF
jgi:hypothetical protein